MASRVRLVLTNVELIDLFMGTLQGMYYENMVDSLSSNFVDIVTLENELRMG